MNRAMLNDPLLKDHPDIINLTTFDSKNGWLNWIKYLLQIEKNDVEKAKKYGCYDSLI